MFQLTRRRFLAGLALPGAGPALAQDDAPTRVILVPLDDFSEYACGEMATRLEREMGIRIRSSMRLPPLPVPVLPGTGQLAGETLLMRAVEASERLPGLLPSTYRVFLTTRDINAQSGGFRYQFSMHMPSLNSSVVSMARLLERGADPLRTDGRSAGRMHKMVKRAIGELHLGWQRSADRHDLMYAPLMSVGDIDIIGTEHRLADGDAPPPTMVEALLTEARDFRIQHGPMLRFAGLLVLTGLARIASSRPDAEPIGEWVYARHAALVRALAACGLPAAALIMLFTDVAPFDAAWWVGAIVILMLGGLAWLTVDVFGSTLRFNEEALEWRRLFRRPRIISLHEARLEPHPFRALFTVRDGAGQAIRLNIRYRTGAIPLVNYLTRRAAPPIGYNDGVKQARQPLAGTARCWREEGPDSIEQGDG